MKKFFFSLTVFFSLIPTHVLAALNVCPKMPVATATSHNWVSAITASGATTLSQPAFSDISSTLANAQLPSTETWPSSGTVLACTPANHGVLVSGSGATATVVGPDSSTTKVLTSGGSSADPSFQAVAGSSFATQTARTFFQGPASGSAATPSFAALSTPTFSSATASGTGTGGFGSSQTGWLFTISTSSTLAVGDTYTNNSNTYTVQGALSAQSGQVLFMSGTGATSGSTLTRSSGAGTSSITFSAKIATYTYTTPTSPVPLYLHILIAGGGGGGGPGGPTSTTGGGTGTASFFGANILTAGGGTGGGFATTGAAGGTASAIGSPAIGFGYAGQAGNCPSGNTGNGGGGNGGSTPFLGGGGNAGYGSGGAGGAAVANSGAGGGGGGQNGSQGGGGGGSSSLINAVVPSPGASYPYAVGTKGSGGTGTAAGGNAGDGVIFVWETMQ